MRGRSTCLSGRSRLLVALLAAPVFILSAIYLLRFRYGRRADRSKAQRGERLAGSVVVGDPVPAGDGLLRLVDEIVLRAAKPARRRDDDRCRRQAMDVEVPAPGGTREINELHVPVGKPIRLTMTRQDVIHSLYVPALRIKQDVLPGRYTQEWFAADKTGVFPCSAREFCGTDHSVMGGRLIVQTRPTSPAGQAQAGADRSLAARARAVRPARLRRAATAATQAAGTARRRWSGSTAARCRCSDGPPSTADDQYIHDSIMHAEQADRRRIRAEDAAVRQRARRRAGRAARGLHPLARREGGQ